VPDPSDTARERGSSRPPVHGLCEPRFSGVREAFEANFRERGEVGAAVCVIVDGRVVVDLVGGFADAARTREWRPDTLVDLYSVGKSLVALLALRSVARGAIALDDPVAAAWPEFAAGGKSTATLRHALCHRAGVPAIRERLADLDLFDWDRMTAALAATEAWWEPGTRHAYHTNTYGHLVGEIVRRTTGAMPGDVLREVASGCDADLWCGLPDEEAERCAEVIWDPPAGRDRIDPWPLSGDARMIALGYFNPPGYSSVGLANDPRWRRAQVPSTNTHGTATGIARLYAALLEPGRLLPASLLAEATRTQSEGFCPVLGEEVAFGLGFVPTTARRPLGPNPRSFGHYGTGGALGFADPDAGVAFGYAMNHVIPRWQSTRNRSLVEALYRC